MNELRWSYINPFTIMKDLLLHIWVVILCAAIAWMGTQLVLENIHKTEYTSSATLFITPKDSTKAAYSNISAGYQMAGVLGNIFTSQIMANKAAQAMGVEILPARVDAQIVENTNLLRLSATARSPEAAFLTVRAIMENHPKVSNYVADNVVAEVLEPPLVPAYPSNYIPMRSSQRMAAIIGALAAVLAIMVLSILRDTVKTEEAARSLVDAPLYGTSPTNPRTRPSNPNCKRNKALLISNPVTSFRYAGYQAHLTKMEYTVSLRGKKVI